MGYLNNLSRAVKPAPPAQQEPETVPAQPVAAMPAQSAARSATMTAAPPAANKAAVIPSAAVPAAEAVADKAQDLAQEGPAPKPLSLEPSGTKSDDAARQAHEAAEAKRKAEFDARQAAKKAAEQERLDRLAAMSDDEVMVASMKQVSADTEKLTRRNMKDCVSEHIQTLCLDDPTFARRVMHPRKSMVNCFRYITQKAWEYVQDEMKASGIQPGPGEQGYGCDVPDDLCYQWCATRS